jgi:hypothetical protein
MEIYTIMEHQGPFGGYNELATLDRRKALKLFKEMDNDDDFVELQVWEDEEQLIYIKLYDGAYHCDDFDDYSDEGKQLYKEIMDELNS